MVASEQHLYQTIVLPRKLASGSIYDYLFVLLPRNEYSFWGTENWYMKTRLNWCEMNKYIKASVSFLNIIPQSTQMHTLYTNVSFYITVIIFDYTGHKCFCKSFSWASMLESQYGVSFFLAKQHHEGAKGPTKVHFLRKCEKWWSWLT